MKKPQHLRIILEWKNLGIPIISYNILLRFIDEICEDVRRIDILLSKRILNHNEYESYIKKLFLFYRRLNYDVLN